MGGKRFCLQGGEIFVSIFTVGASDVSLSGQSTVW